MEAKDMSESRQSFGRCFVISPIGQEGTDVRRHADEVFKHIIPDSPGFSGKISDH